MHAGFGTHGLTDGRFEQLTEIRVAAWEPLDLETDRGRDVEDVLGPGDFEDRLALNRVVPQRIEDRRDRRNRRFVTGQQDLVRLSRGELDASGGALRVTSRPDEMQSVADLSRFRPLCRRARVSLFIAVQHEVDDELPIGIAPLPHGVGAHLSPDFRIDLEPRLVPRDSRFLLLGEESRQVEMRLSGPCRRDDELDAQIARMGAGAEVLQSGTAEGDAAEGRAEVFDGEDRGFEGADGCS